MHMWGQTQKGTHWFHLYASRKTSKNWSMALEVRIAVILGLGYIETKRASAVWVKCSVSCCLELPTIHQALQSVMVHRFTGMLCFHSNRYCCWILGEAKVCWRDLCVTPGLGPIGRMLLSGNPFKSRTGGASPTLRHAPFSWATRYTADPAKGSYLQRQRKGF